MLAEMRAPAHTHVHACTIMNMLTRIINLEMQSSKDTEQQLLASVQQVSHSDSSFTSICLLI